MMAPEIDRGLLEKIADLIGNPGGALNIRTDSGGEVKRIEIATILARSASLMIFDEPEAGIDLWSFARLTETFEQLHAMGRATMIIISHQERIISLADEVIVVGQGTIQHRGSAEEILPRILADTLGTCPVLTRGGDRV